MNQKTKVEREVLIFRIIKIIILSGVAASILFGYSLYDETKQAKVFCDSVNGSYEFKILSTISPLFCDDVPIYRFNPGWFGYSIEKQTNVNWELVPIN